MKKIFKRTKAKIFITGLIFMNLTLAIISGSAYADEVLWEFNVPVNLKNMPGTVEYVVIEWELKSELFGSVLAEDSIFILMNANSKGDFFHTETITIYESDVDDPTKPEFIIFTLRLSKDGVTAYMPNYPGEAWTKQKKGATLKLNPVVTFIDLQTNPKKGPV